MRVLPNDDVSYLDPILLDGPFLKLLPAEEYKKLHHDHLSIWAIRNARYQFPTLELIDWLRSTIGARYAIEVAAGMGDLGRHLGIMQTDSYMQQRPEMKVYYKMLGQPTTSPPNSVYEYEALEAVKGLKPEIVVASWLTQLIKEGEDDITPETQGSVYGANEVEIIKSVKMYIHIGNDGSHAQKKALALPHEKFYFPWLVSRAEDQSKNVIYIWGK